MSQIAIHLVIAGALYLMSNDKKEDFTNPMILNNDSRYEKILFKNAPTGNLDKILDNQSNESINLDNSTDLCRNCKVAVCKDDYCGLQNHLFM